MTRCGEWGTQYSWADIRNLWLRNGGSPAAADLAASVAMAESGGWDHATGCNPGSVDYGFWQINSLYNGGSEADYNHDTNARHAIRDSNNGATWRPWCSAWSDNACGTKGGQYLAPGSNALEVFQQMAQGGGGSAVSGVTGQPPGFTDTGAPVHPAPGATQLGPVGGLPSAQEQQWGLPGLPNVNEPSVVTSPGTFGFPPAQLGGAVSPENEAMYGPVAPPTGPVRADEVVFAKDLPGIAKGTQVMGLMDDAELASAVRGIEALGA